MHEAKSYKLKGKNQQFNSNNWGLNASLLIIGRIKRQKINKETEDLTSTINQLDQTDIYRTLHQIKQNSHTSEVHIKHFAV